MPHPRDPDRFDRILRRSLLASVAIHAAILLLAGPLLQIRPMQELLRRPATQPVRMAEMEWVVPVPEGAEGDGRAAAVESVPSTPAMTSPSGTRAAPRLEQPTVVRVRPGAEDAPAGGGEAAAVGGGGVRDALRPGYRDPRLYVDPRRIPLPEKSDREKYMEHLHARIDAVNDSIYGEAEAARRATDWTVTDKKGRRWGLSPEGLHLGGVTVPDELLPRPRATGDNASQEAEREKQRQREEIRRQEDERERRRAREESTRTTRERKDGERRRGGGGGS